MQIKSLILCALLGYSTDARKAVKLNQGLAQESSMQSISVEAQVQAAQNKYNATQFESSKNLFRAVVNLHIADYQVAQITGQNQTTAQLQLIDDYNNAATIANTVGQRLGLAGTAGILKLQPNSTLTNVATATTMVPTMVTPATQASQSPVVVVVGKHGSPSDDEDEDAFKRFMANKRRYY